MRYSYINSNPSVTNLYCICNLRYSDTEIEKTNTKYMIYIKIIPKKLLNSELY